MASNESAMLIDYDGDRRNNFTVLRTLFAWMVLFGHSFALTGYGHLNPLKPFFQGSTWIGEVAVSGFFAISGFLVTASFVRRGLLDYTVSRMLRIYPALIVCVGLTVFVLGPSLTTLDRQAYFADSKTWDYLWNATSLFVAAFKLPGLFDDLTRGSANGSLWTLPVEVSCYILLAVTGYLGLLRSRFLANLTLVALLLFGMSYFSDIPLLGRSERWAAPSIYFLVGVAFYINRAHIPLTGRLAMFAALLFYFGLGEKWFDLVAPIALPYLVFYLAYQTPHVPLDKWLGDFSYGIYIYAWPVQQTIIHFFPEEGPYFNTAVATFVTVTLAALSWRFIEKPALGLKSRFFSNGAKA